MGRMDSDAPPNGQVLVACHEPPCSGQAIADRGAHQLWHEEQRAAPTEHDLTFGDIVAGWLDELDPQAIEELVLAEAPSMSESAVAGTIRVLRKLARGDG